MLTLPFGTSPAAEIVAEDELKSRFTGRCPVITGAPDVFTMPGREDRPARAAALELELGIGTFCPYATCCPESKQNKDKSGFQEVLLVEIIQEPSDGVQNIRQAAAWRPSPAHKTSVRHKAQTGYNCPPNLTYTLTSRIVEITI